MVQATWRFIPVVLCFPEYSSLCPSHDQHGSSVPSRMYWASGSRSSAVGTNSRVASGTSGVTADMARLIVGCGYAERLAYFRLCTIMPHVGQRGHYRFEKTEAWRPIRGILPPAARNLSGCRGR